MHLTIRTILRYVDLVTDTYSQQLNLRFNVYASDGGLDTKTNILSIVSFLWHNVSRMSTSDSTMDLTGVKSRIDNTEPSSYPQSKLSWRVGCQRSVLTALSNTMQNKNAPLETFQMQTEQSEEAEARYFPFCEKAREFTESQCFPIKVLCSTYTAIVILEEKWN